MLLQPRKFRYKSKHKLRRLNYRSNLKSSKVTYGQVGLLLKQPLRLNSRSIFRIKIFLNKASKRGEDTRRKIWILVFPHLPLTKKHIGSRMGKGIGKLKTWVSQLPSGTVIIELRNLRVGRSLYFLSQLQVRIKCMSEIIFRSQVNYLVPTYFNTKKISYQSFW